MLWAQCSLRCIIELKGLNMSSKMVEAFYNNGNIRQRHHENEQGQYHGVYQQYNKNGKLTYQCYYENDLYHGLRQTWGANGLLDYQLEFVHGKQQGVQQHWYEDGTLSYYDFAYDGKRIVEVNCTTPVKILIHQYLVNAESSAFLVNVITDFDSKGIEYIIEYI
jgi:antitoxin component YwqK of YwqJK toxin-antitoxin module